MTAGNDERGLETPLADLIEQQTPVDDDLDAGAAGTGPLGELGEADEADVVEQSIPVPTEVDYRSGGGR
ncbi:MAG TPA: hypothetical protein VIJ00_12135 [Nakamurella sp.]